MRFCVAALSDIARPPRVTGHLQSVFGVRIGERESEKLVRTLFALARHHAPSISAPSSWIGEKGLLEILDGVTGGSPRVVLAGT